MSWNSKLAQTVLLVSLAAGLRSRAEASVFVVSNLNDSGAGSLRQAMLDANTNPGRDTIAFNISGSAPFTIVPASALPALTDPVVMDGTTQPGYVSDPVVGLVGTGASTANGLSLQTGDSEVRALFINRFSGNGIQIQNGSSNVIAGCYIGTSPNGATKLVNAVAGVAIFSGRSNRIGGTNAADRNLLSGNLNGLYIAGLSATGNVVQGNFIGTDLTGTVSLGNANNGVLLSAPGNLVGGVTPAARNLISGNSQSGVYIHEAFASNNWVGGNFIGVKLSGASGLSNVADGVTIFRATHNLIGGSVPGAGNLISANGERGIYIFTTTSNANDNRVEGNLIGTDATGRTNLGNRYSGVGITTGQHNVVGGTNAFARNIISGNRQSGVAIDSNSVANVIAGNIIGLDANGTNALANTLNGVSIVGGGSNVIGGATAGAGNVISGNAQNGVLLVGGAAHSVLGNRIGTDAAGLAARGNVNSGVRIEGSGHTVGGSGTGARNVISGNLNNGVLLMGAAASNNVVAGNFIGLDATGTARLGNNFYGVSLSDAPRNVIGLSEPSGGNVISGNTNTGLSLSGPGTTGNFILGNFIGPDATGSNALPNTVGAITMFRAGTNFIGGAAPGEGNVLSGNENVTIYVDTANGNVIRGNLVGLRPEGTTPMGNFLHGIELLNSSSFNLIGGLAAGEGNRIANVLSSSLGYDGVRIRDGCVGNTIRGNSIYNNGGSHVNGLGIDWSVDGPTTTNPLKFPALTGATGRHLTIITGSLTGTAGAAYLMDFYGNTALDASGYGEGQRWIGTLAVTMPAGGTTNFTIKFTNAVPVGGYVSATTTDAAGNTSEFAQTIPVAAAPDTDGDGMPDDFEIAFGLNPNSAADRDLDADHDGASNYQEFLAGTKPNDASSAFRLTLQSQAGRTFVFVETVAGVTYHVEAATNVTGPWEVLADGQAGTGARLRAVDPGMTARRFYKARAN